MGWPTSYQQPHPLLEPRGTWLVSCSARTGPALPADCTRVPSIHFCFITTTILTGTWLSRIVGNLEAIKCFQDGILLAWPAASPVPVSWILS